MPLIVFQSPAELAESAAQMIAFLLLDGVEKRGAAHIALSGGGTPRPLYERLGRGGLDVDIPWPQVHIWWADERSVPPDDPGSNYRLARESLLEQVALRPEHVHRMRGEIPAREAAVHYAAELRAAAPGEQLWPRLDVAIMGMGEDGHTASLFPGEPPDEELTRPVIPVTADYQGRPAGRVTLTPLVLNASRNILIVVTGEAKAARLAAVLSSEREPPAYPINRLRPLDGGVTWLVDRAAAQALEDSS